MATLAGLYLFVLCVYVKDVNLHWPENSINFVSLNLNLLQSEYVRKEIEKYHLRSDIK